MSNELISQWWAQNPMTYGKEHGTTEYRTPEGAEQVTFGTKDFFERADRQLREWNLPLEKDGKPFAKIYPFEKYRGKEVLEVGCGMGGMAMLWAQAGANITAVDLNPVAIQKTKERFSLYDLKGRIQQEDGNRLSLPGDTFDYAYSWGVLHHSPNLEKSIAELFRVLKPGGEFGVMLYSRRSFQYWYLVQYLEGFLHRENAFLNPLQLASRYSDGARQEGNPHTWPVTPEECVQVFSPFAESVKVETFGTDLDVVFRHLIPGLGAFLPAWAKKPWARRFGWSLWISGRKK